MEERNRDFKGYEMDILIRISKMLNIPFNTIVITCYFDESELLVSLMSDKINFGIGGIIIDYKKLKEGYVYSLPLYTGGLKIAVKTLNDGNVWTFFDPFHWTLWIAILGTTFFVSIVTWFFEDSFTSSYFLKK